MNATAFYSDITSLLARHARSIRALGNQRWLLKPTEGALSILAAQDGDWLALECDAPREAVVVSEWEVLTAGTMLAGNVRFVAGVDDARLRLNVDIPLGDELDFDLEANEEIALCLAHLVSACGPHTVDRDPADPAPTDLGPLADACAAAGWRSSQRPDGTLVATIDARRGPMGAILSQASEDCWRAEIEILRSSEIADASREAIGRLLMGLSRATRLCQPVAIRDDRGTSVLLRTTWPRDAAPARTGVALEALTAACRMAADEVRILAADPAIAAAYLSMVSVSFGRHADAFSSA